MSEQQTWQFQSRSERPPAQSWIDPLIALSRSVKEAAAAAGRARLSVTNAKGDVVHAFDIKADEAAITFLRQLEWPVLVDSEESSQHVVGAEMMRWRLVLDPVDGSDNWSRSLPLSAFSCAVLSADAALTPDAVEAAIIAPLDHTDPWVAAADEGVWRGTQKLSTSDVRIVDDAVVSIELNHHAPTPALTNLMRRARGVRSYGCASRALALVASGATDAHVDVRGRLTAESYLAGAFMVKQAGGSLRAGDGLEIKPVSRLTEGRTLIAAATPHLIDQIIRMLRNDDD